MQKHFFIMRILRSLVSIFLVTTLTYIIVYTLVPRKLIFKQDPNYNKISARKDRKIDYQNNVFERLGYIDYYDSKELQQKISKIGRAVTAEPTTENRKIYERYIERKGGGWTLKQFEENQTFYAVREIPIYERVFKFYVDLVQIDHPWKIQDKNNKGLERYIRIEKDAAIGWSIVGSGTKHKYLLYLNSRFPYIHQNFVTFNLGRSYPTYSNIPVLQVISQGQGQTKKQLVQFPKGAKMSSVDIYSRTYKTPSTVDEGTIANFGEGDSYTATRNRYQNFSMLINSMIIGLIGLIINYGLGLPLGITMARYKNCVVDNIATISLTFLMSLPSVATIYMVRLIGSLIGFPDSFPTLGASDWRSYILPACILGILGAPFTAVWFRRYLIDQQSSDYVRFARAKGLSEREIVRHHIFKNAMVSIVVGIPSSVVGVISGATLTESVFAFPGMGKMLISSVQAANNSMVVGLTFILTVLTIMANMIGDIWMTILDPRIQFSEEGDQLCK